MKNTHLLSAVPLSSDGEKRLFTGLAYSGGPVDYFGGRLVVDIEGINFSDRMPVLVDHDVTKRVGVGELFQTEAGLEIRGHLLRNSLAREVAADADDGFPWQMSIRVDAGSVEEVKSGTTVNVNGADYEGPLYVFRRNTVSEVSFVPLGADSTTYAQVFARGTNGEDPMQELDELKAEVEALKASLADMTTRAEAAEATVAQTALAKRRADAIALLSAMESEATDEAIEPYLAMGEEVFAAVAAHTKAALAKRPALPTALFGHKGFATDAENPLLADAKRRR